METESRRATAAVIHRLEDRPREFSYFQSLRLLRCACREELESREALFDILRRHVRVRPVLSLGFPPVDIDTMERLPALAETPQAVLPGEVSTLPLWKLTVTFLGLYGASSPLPTYYTEDLLADRSNGISVNRDLVDMLNQPFYELLWLSWRRYRIPLRIVEEGDTACMRRLWALGGRDPELLKQRLPHRDGFTLRRLALYAQHPRSQAALTTLLRDVLGIDAVGVRPFAMRKVPLPADQRCRMGFANSGLGEDCVLGEQIEDCRSCFDLDIGPVDTDTYRSLLPGRDRHRQLRACIDDFLDQPLDFMLNLTLEEDENRAARLQAGHWGSLGEDMWLQGRSRPSASGGQISLTRDGGPGTSGAGTGPTKISFFIANNRSRADA